jgi:hypothetical protein
VARELLPGKGLGIVFWGTLGSRFYLKIKKPPEREAL